MMIEGKVALITGMGSGLGEGMVQGSARHGAKIVGCDWNRDSGQAVIDRVSSDGAEAIFLKCDVSREDEVERMAAQAIERYGRIDILINNAGVNYAAPFEKMSYADWDRVINTDLRGTFLCCHVVIREMLKSNGGSIINIGTVHTLASLPGAAPYDAAKCGVLGLSKALAVEYADRNIRVNVLSPGLCATQIWEDIKLAAPSPEAALDHWKANIPMARPAKAEEIANVALFLASDLSSYLTGANIVADGGMTSQLVSREPFESSALDGE